MALLLLPGWLPASVPGWLPDALTTLGDLLKLIAHFLGG